MFILVQPLKNPTLRDSLNLSTPADSSTYTLNKFQIKRKKKRKRSFFFRGRWIQIFLEAGRGGVIFILGGLTPVQTLLSHFFCLNFNIMKEKKSWHFFGFKKKFFVSVQEHKGGGVLLSAGVERFSDSRKVGFFNGLTRINIGLN